MEAQLIPGLPEDVADECLLRVSVRDFASVRGVSKLWKGRFESPSFHSLRKSAGAARPLVALSQSEPSPPQSSAQGKRRPDPRPLVYRLSLFEPDTGSWSALPQIPGRRHGLPLFCQIAAVGTQLVVFGGWNSRTWASSDEVRIYDLVTATWRRGARMPGPRRSFFACAASEDRRMVFVAGGHDESKDALRSALAYDLAADAWIRLPDMTRQRDECRGVFAGGCFLVLGGYPTEAQAQFSPSTEGFDVADWRWSAVEEGALKEAACPRTSVVGGDGRLYMCLQGGQVMALQETNGGGRRDWRRVSDLPGEVRAALQMVAWKGALMVLGSGSRGGAQVAYVLEMAGEEQKWRKVELPREFSGHVQAACCLQI